MSSDVILTSDLKNLLQNFYPPSTCDGNGNNDTRHTNNNMLFIKQSPIPKEDDLLVQELPLQVIACLKLTGCYDVNCLRMMKDVSVVETFLVENAQLLKETQPDSAKLAFGLFYNCPEKFKFLPGHLIKLNHVISKLNKEDGGHQARKRKKAPNSSALFVQPSSTETEEPSSRRRRRVFVSNNNRGTECSETKAATENDGQVSSGVLDKLKSNITKWATRQSSPFGELKEGVHYKLDITATKRQITCLFCNKECNLGFAKGSYMVSNYTRHLLKMCTALKKSNGSLIKALQNKSSETVMINFDSASDHNDDLSHQSNFNHHSEEKLVSNVVVINYSKLPDDSENEEADAIIGI